MKNKRRDLTPLIKENNGITYYEEWKDVENYEGEYAVSNFGRLKSYARKIGVANIPDMIIGGGISRGYIYFSLFKEKIKKQIGVHILVGRAFVPNNYNKPCVGHIDNNPLNNNFWNLEWCTHKENMEHASKCKRFKLGENQKNSKLNEKQVLDIYYSEESQYKLAIHYGVTQGTISSIKLGRIWAYLTNKKYEPKSSSYITFIPKYRR